MKRIGAFLLVLCILCVSLTALAANTATVSASLDVRDFSVKVQGESLQPLAWLSVITVPEKTDPFQAAKTGIAVYIGQTLTDADGRVNTDIGLSPDAAHGFYEVCLIDAGSGNLYRSNVFEYAPSASMSSALEQINQATKVTMGNVLESTKEVLLLDTKEYDELSASDARQSVADILYDSRPSSSGFADVYAVHSAFGAAVATVAISGTDAEDAGTLLEKYAVELGIDWSLLEKCSGSARKYTLELLTKGIYKTPKALAERYAEAVFAGRAAAAQTAGELQSLLLEEYTDVLNLSLTAYRNLNNPSKVFSSLLKYSFTGFEDANAAFDKAVDAQAALEKKANNDGGSSSGGGNYGGGGSPVMPDQGNVDNMPASPEQQELYHDLDGMEWAEEAIAYLTERNILSGDGNGMFRPNENITRAEFAKVLTVTFDLTESAGSMSFEDVTAEDWYTHYVSAGVKAGLIKGISSTWFGASDFITRQDLAVKCYRATQAVGMEMISLFDRTPIDAEAISDYALEAVEMFYSAGIVNGDPDGSFRPLGGATRAEAAKIIAELLWAKEDK